jgi:hypothetical protein
MTENISMDDFGPVSVDYFHGRRVERVDVHGTPGEGEPVWTIVMEGNGLIENFDPTIPSPTAIVGAALTRTILEHDKTRLQFGLEQVTLNPMQYAIVYEGYTQGKRVFAQRSRYDMPTSLPEEPKNRTADGPEVHPDE